MKKTITITIDDGEDAPYAPYAPPPANGLPGGFGTDLPPCCENCPNRPGGPLNKTGICNCALPSMYGPWRIT